MEQEVKSISESLFGASRCSCDKAEASAFNDDTIYVAEQIIEKFYPKASSPKMVTEDEMDITLKKLRGRKYYEEKEFGLPIRLVPVRANQKAGKLLPQNLEILSSQ